MWTFFDYVTESGNNEFHAWLHALSSKARAKINMRISTLEQLPRAEWADRVGPLTGSQWDGIFEIRLQADKIQYRPLFCYGLPREASTILMGAQERGDIIEPRSASLTCRSRKSDVMGGGHAEQHRYD